MQSLLLMEYLMFVVKIWGMAVANMVILQIVKLVGTKGNKVIIKYKDYNN